MSTTGTEGKLLVKMEYEQGGPATHVHYKELILSTIKAALEPGYEFNEREICFVFPFTYQALDLLEGIEATYFSRNCLCAAVLTRSLLDSVLSLHYVIQVASDDFPGLVSEFIRSGELTKPPNSEGKRRRLTGRDLAKAYKKTTGIEVYEAYTALSKIVHSTKSHFDSGLQPVPGVDSAFRIRFDGEKTEYPQFLFDELKVIIDLCVIRIASVWDSMCTTPKFMGMQVKM